MLDAARGVLYHELDPLSEDTFTACSRHSIVELALRYFAAHPQTFLAAPGTNSGPSQPELGKIAALVDTPPKIRAENLLELPAPAALSSLGLVNSLTFVLNILTDPAGNQKSIPFCYSMAAAMAGLPQGRRLLI